MDHQMTPDPRTKEAELVFGERNEGSPAAPSHGHDVARSDRSTSVLGYIAESAKSLVTGMGITLRYFTHPSEIVTAEYPDNRETLKFPARFRGRVVMPHDESGEHKCTACTMCEKACPNGSISILATKNVAGKRVLGRFVYRLSQCTLCNLCIEACPFGAIEMGHDYEMASEKKEDFDCVLNKKEGR
jgi:NADH-quinone oxidoreductase subunit I